VEGKVKGRMKEAAGAFTGDKEKKAEGRAQLRRARQARRRLRGPRPDRPRRKPKRPRGNATGSGARTRVRWAA
jgi:hypothetical protein